MDFSDLEDLTPEGKIKAPTKSDSEYARKTFTCEACGGTGQWSGGRNRRGNSKCHVCNGRGELVTSKADRLKQRATRHARKDKLAEENRAANLAHGDGALVEFLKDNTWSDFARSLLEAHNAGKLLSEKQVEAARRFWVKCKARDKERAAAKAEREAAAPQVDLTPIKTMFDNIVGKGFKRPKYRAEGVILSLAPAHGANAGHLYVKGEDETYLGKITPDMRFLGSRDAGSEAEAALHAIAADPTGAAIRYGRRTGRCACCGRELTNHDSIERGIGPICAERWGL